MPRRPAATRRVLCALVVLCAAMTAAAAGPDAGDPQTVYDDQLRNGWADWSWATHDLAATAFVHSGTKAISFVPAAWQAVYLHKDGGVSGAAFDALQFFVNGGAGAGQNLRIVFVLGGSVVADRPLTDFLPGGPRKAAWDAVTVGFDAAGVGTRPFDGIYWQDGSGGTQPAVYLDDITLVPRDGGPSATTVTVMVDPAQDRRPISRYIYGVSEGSAPPRYPVRRWGGNATTRYNWRQDVGNRASDWFFQNIANDTDVARLPDGSAADRFVDDARADGAEPLLTVPLIGWTPRDRVKRWGFSVAKYGAQHETECTRTGWPAWCEPDAGNGVRPDGSTLVTGNDPADTSIAITPAFVTDWMTHLGAKVRWFALDNEPMLWNRAHRDVHPAPVDCAEIWQRTRDYAAAIKTKDPAAQVFGPVVWGWCAYFYSAKDGCAPGPDHAAHGPFLEWYLAQVEAYRQAHGVRLVDWLDIHYYPQAANVALSDDESAETSALRLRSLKSLYDPAYVDESWIGEPVALIPRMKDILARRAPAGTKLALTEYNWGNDDGLSSALAQVEALAIFGREGVDLAARWVAPAPGSRVEQAFAAYLDYDGSGASVEGDSVRAASANVDDLGAYAVRRADGRLYFVLVNKATALRTADVTVAGGLTGLLTTYALDAVDAWGPRDFLTPSATGFVLDLPARSAWLVVGQEAPCAVPATPAGLAVTRAGSGPAATLHFAWTDVAGATSYAVHEDTAPSGAFASETGTAASGTSGLTVAMPAGTHFYLVAARSACGESPLR